ncbi:conserved exported hypothetical protein [Candidatus Sulfotelmatomonas gaucii]|uniref:Outer membrane protein beta-barrel domain-containing protein n=1 Tax=Candidatus Sulfuritelmatomonas gaucii TaxID=2043161 RepID=A0A2N9L5A6_9BACT|nr:conserved exported hypothetical protein [Candidatus Sulfotelmatomonas gaucii]
MSYTFWMRLARCAGLAAAVVLFTCYVANAQSTAPSQDQASSGQASSSQASDTSYSSSQSGTAQVAELALPEAPAPRPSAAASGQYGNGGGNGGGEKKGIFHRLTFEAGGGFNAPISSSVTYGFNLTVGGGVRFDPHFSTLIEYQFLDDKLPGALIAETNGEATGGNAHIWSFTVDPVVDLAPKATNDVYVTGGGGFYRKVTTFTFPMAQEFCTYFTCGIGYVPGTVGHFSSNQGGFNVGGGFQHRLGGMYGESTTALFAEVRYLDVLSPAIVGKSANGLPPVTIDKDTKVLPISFGVRW